MRDRELLQELFVRVCRDSNFRLDHVRAAILTGQIANRAPLEVWIALGSTDLMERISTGKHPASQGKSK